MESVLKFLKNHRIYFVLLVVFVIIRVLPLDIFPNVEDCLNDIAVGGISSVIVALLLQISMDKHKKELVDRTEKQLFEPLKKYIQQYYSILTMDMNSYGTYPGSSYRDIGLYLNAWMEGDQFSSDDLDLDELTRIILYISGLISSINSCINVLIINDGISSEALSFIESLKKEVVKYNASMDDDEICEFINDFTLELEHILSNYNPLSDLDYTDTLTRLESKGIV